jgi:acetyl-CoA C-acetyltransferase
MGCVDPVGEAGGDIPRMARSPAGLAITCPACRSTASAPPGSTRQFRRRAGDGRPARSDDRRRRRIDEPRRHRRRGGAWPVDPSFAVANYFMPQGISADLIATKYGFSRDDVDAYAVQSQKRAGGVGARSALKNRSRRCATSTASRCSIATSTCVLRPTCSRWRALKPSFVMMGEQGGFDAVAIQAHPEVERSIHVHHAGNSSGIVDGAAAVLIGSARRGRSGWA